MSQIIFTATAGTARRTKELLSCLLTGKIMNHTPIIKTYEYSYLKLHNSRTLFTNTDSLKKDDPFATLGIQWGATTKEIKEAYKRKARELHPDINKTDSPQKAIEKFQAVQKAYTKLMDVKGAPYTHRDDLMEEWSFAVWRNADIVAQERDDVAGVMKKRPVKPAVSLKAGNRWGIASLGHPDGRGNQPRRGEYLGDGSSSGLRSNSVGTGQNKWVEMKKYKPYLANVKVKAVRRQPESYTIEKKK